MRIREHYGCPTPPKGHWRGPVKTCYIREGKRWVKVGYICMGCRFFTESQFDFHFGDMRKPTT